MGCRPNGHFHVLALIIVSCSSVSVGCRPNGHFHILKSNVQLHENVSVGCRPNGHFHKKQEDDFGAEKGFSGLSPKWSLSRDLVF